MIEIKITGNTPLEALSSLTACGLHCMQDKAVWAATNRIMEAEKHTEAKKAADEPSASPPPPADPSGPATGGNGPTAAPSDGPTHVPVKEDSTLTPGPAPVKEDPAPSQVDPTPDPKPASGDKAPSLEDIRAKGIEAAKKYGQPAIKAILKEFGAANMTTLPEDKRAAFMAKLEGLGEGNA